MYLIPTIEIKEENLKYSDRECRLNINIYIMFWEINFTFEGNSRYWLIAFLILFELYLLLLVNL